MLFTRTVLEFNAFVFAIASAFVGYQVTVPVVPVTTIFAIVAGAVNDWGELAVGWAVVLIVTATEVLGLSHPETVWVA